MPLNTVEFTLLLVLLGVVFGPIVVAKLRLPSVIGLIASGIVVGPFVLGWVPARGLAAELGAIGILYLMFLAGIGFDLSAFRANRRIAVAYGLLGFLLPFGLSVVVMLSVADIELLGAALIGAMWASNTLIAYPEVQAAGLQGSRSVSAAVSAGVVADLLSLTVLGMATATAVVEIDPDVVPLLSALTDLLGDDVIRPSTPDPVLPIWLGLPLLVGFCLWGLPRIAAWFFVNVGRSRDQRFVFSLACMAAGASVALLGGLEGLIGAFLAGLGLNRRIPAESQLMDRIEFVGSSFFVPMFLVSIGLSIDPALLIDPTTVGVAMLFTLFVVVGKTGAALVIARRFSLGRDEMGLMASLSFGQAASTLAIAQVGLQLNMFDQTVVNAAVIAIVTTALLTSYGTRYFVQRMPVPVIDRPPVGQRVLLDIRDNGSAGDQLVAVAAAIAASDRGIVVPYRVATPAALATAQVEVDEAVGLLAARGLDAEGLVRVDESFGGATDSLVMEHHASAVLLSWRGFDFPSDYVFGNEIDRVGGRSSVPAMAVRVLRPWRRVVILPGRQRWGWQQEDAELTVDLGSRLRPPGGPMVVAAHSDEEASGLVGPGNGVETLVTAGHVLRLLDFLDDDDLVIASAHALRKVSPFLERRVAQRLQDMNVIVVGGPRRLVFSRGNARSGSVGVHRPSAV